MELFGYELKKKSNEIQGTDPGLRLPVEEADGTTVTSSGSNAAEVFSMDPTWRSEADLIQYYRDMAMNHNVDRAIEEIVTDAIVVDAGKQPVKIDFEDGSDISTKIQDRIVEEFEGILQLLDFKHDGPQAFRDFYIDGRLAYFKVVDPKNIKKGIQGLQRMDVLNLKKYRNVETKKDGRGNEYIASTREFYSYGSVLTSPFVQYQVVKKEIQINSEAVSYVTSGIIDKKKNWVLSYLHKAVRPYNHLRLLEDASLIYQIARAPERRVFYVDVGNLPRARAEQYLKDIMSQYRNKISYDAVSGDIKDSKREMSMLEDIWLPRREGCFSLDTKIRLLDGRTVELGQLIVEHKLGKENWVYSVAPDGSVVPGLISWAGVTRNNATVLEVHLDNGEVVTATPDHKFILQNGEQIEAQNLEEGSSLMPMKESEDLNIESISDEDNHKYESLWSELKLNRGYKDTTEDKPAAQITDTVKVTKIVHRMDQMDVGTLTIDENHIHHDYHNFALASGIFVMNSKGTEISTLGGGMSLSTETLEFFKGSMYDSLNIPRSRLETGAGFSLGRSSEITRDEVKFASFISKLRNRFSFLFYDLLKTQLVLKGVISESEWKSVQYDIQFVFESNVLFAEMKETEIIQQRIANLRDVEGYIGQFFSKRWVQKNVLFLTDTEIEDLEKEIADEVKSGKIPDPTKSEDF